MSAQGRGPDSTLVHMSPREVSGLQSLAMANGGTLTINPETGLPEAGFLDSLMPTLLGGAATFFSGGAITPFMAALGVGGLTALTSKDLGKGLMAGLGAYGGAGITEGLAGFGANAIGAEAATAALPSGASSVSGDYDLLQAQASNAAQKGASYSDRLSRGLTEGFKNPMGAVKAIGGGSTFKGAAMIGAPLLSALSSQDQTSVPTPEQIKFDPSYANINITREQLPYQRDTGSSGQRGYFGPTYINRNAAEGGFVSDNGIEHFGAGGRTRRDPVERMPYIRNGQILTPADLVNIGNRGSKRFTPVIRPNQPEKPVVQQPIQPITQQPMEPTRPVAQQPIEPPRPQQPMEPTQPTQRRIDETGMVPRQVVENPVIVPRLEGGRDSAARGGLMALAVGGGVPLDPNYDYSGYGRKKTDVVRPVTPMPDMPKPDFLAADGKTYRYDPIKRSWYVIKEAEAKTNPGVETLMGGEGRGNDSITSRDTAPIADNGFFSSILGRTTRTAAPVEEKSTYSTLAQAEADKAATAKQAASDAREDAREAKDAADQAARDAATSASSPTATGGKANSPSGIAALGVDFNARQDEADAAVMAGNNAASEKAANAAYGVTAQGQKNQMDAQTEQDAAIQSQADREAQSVQNARDIAGKAMAQDIAALVSELSDNPNANPGNAPSLGTGTTAGWGGSDIGGSDIGGNYGDSSPDSIANGGMVGRYAQGGLGSLGGYSDGGRLLRGPGDGVSDSIPATVGGRQPARLADGEFVVPARIVSELGNGSTEAGARALYKMMDRIQANRRKTTGKNKVAVNSKSHKYLPA